MAVITTEQEFELGELAGSADRLAVLRQLLDAAEAQHEELIHQAVHAGKSIEEVSAAARVTSARVRRLIRRPPLRR